MFLSKPCFFIMVVTWMPASHGQFPVLCPHLFLLYGSLFSFSSAYICQANDNCLRLLRQLVRLADSFARASAGNNKDARMAIIAITTSSSINVNARVRLHGGTTFFFISQKLTGTKQNYTAPQGLSIVKNAENWSFRN